MPQSMTTIITQATEYRTTANNKARCHFVMSENAGQKSLILGLITTVFSSIVGTTIFAALSGSSQSFLIQLITGFMSVTAAVLAALQTFLRLGDTSGLNKTAAVGYERIKVTLNNFLLTYPPDSTDTDKAVATLTIITNDLEKVEESSPSIPDSVYRKVVGKHPVQNSSTGSVSNTGKP